MFSFVRDRRGAATQRIGLNMMVVASFPGLGTRQTILT